MRAPPSKWKPPAYFFKFIRPGPKCQLSIPKSFTEHLKSRRNNKTAILRRGCQKWPVKIVDNWVFGDGWEIFVRENGVQDFDFVVFKHEGDMVFDTVVFDASCCEREYPSNKVVIMKAEKALPEAKSLHNHKIDSSASMKIPKGKDTYTKRTSNSSKFEIGNKLIRFRSEAELGGPNIRSKRVKSNAQEERDGSKLINKSLKSVLKAEETRIPDHNHHPYFIENKLIRCRSEAELGGPNTKSKRVKFNAQAERDGSNLINKSMKSLIKVEETRIIDHNHHPYLIGNKLIHCRGEAELADPNTRHKRVKSNAQAKRDCSNSINKSMKSLLKVEETWIPDHNHHPYYVGTLKSCKYKLYLPTIFVTSNGLSNGEMTLRNGQTQMSWMVHLESCLGKYSHIGRGWNDFYIANGLQEGDCFKLELFRTGIKPIAIFYNLRSKPYESHGMVETEGLNSHRSFVGTLQSYGPRSCLYLQKKFALSNGLSNGEMILKNVENEGSWTVNLKHHLGKYCVQRGWHEFCIANGLKKGDKFWFELIQNGQRPVANISRISKETPKANSAKTKAAHNPYFKSIATSCTIKKSFMNVPMRFARSNGLYNKNCEMVVMDEKRRLWPAILRHIDDRVLMRGLRDMLFANGVKKGDEFLFELVDNGKKPLMNFHIDRHENASAQRESLNGRVEHGNETKI